MAITLNGNTIHLTGNFITKGKKAPNFHLVQTDLSEFCLNDKIVNVLFPAYNHYVGCKTVDYKDAST